MNMVITNGLETSNFEEIRGVNDPWTGPAVKPESKEHSLRPFTKGGNT